MRPAARAANDDVGINSQRGERERQERERQAVTLPKHPGPIEPARAHIVGAEFGIGPRRLVQGRVDGCVGKRTTESEYDALRATRLGQVVMRNRDASAPDRVPGLHASQPRLDRAMQSSHVRRRVR